MENSIKPPIEGKDKRGFLPGSDPLALSIVAPCHNEEKNIDALLRRVSTVCGELVGDEYEIVLINDGSTDSTWEAIHKAAQDQPNIVGVNLSRNHGHQLALSAGLSMTRGNRILIGDDGRLMDVRILPGTLMAMTLKCSNCSTI